MLLQTNSYVVPKDKRTEHARLIKRFRAVMARLGLTDFEVYEQAGPNWSTEVGGRFVQIMRFRDREHQKAVREAEAADASAQELVREFCELVNFAYQHQQGIATTAFYLNANAPAGIANAKRLPDGSTQAAEGETPLGMGDDVNNGTAADVSPFHASKPARAAAKHDVED